MVPESDVAESQGPWNPGIKSTLPIEYLPLSTLFRPENVESTIDTALELHKFTGLPLQQLIVFKPQRLIIHELLIRVSADIFISDGLRYEDLGINFRSAVDTILENYIKPQEDHLIQSFQSVREAVKSEITSILDSSVFAAKSQTEKQNSGWLSWFGKKGKSKSIAPPEPLIEQHQKTIQSWEQKQHESSSTQTMLIYCYLIKACNALLIKHNRIQGDQSIITSIVLGMVMNDYGSQSLGALIAPLIDTSIKEHPFNRLKTQQHPVVINIKGASAAGKSTMRPLQHRHTEKIGLNWQDFALISPDIWRKYLLDYDSLGEAYKYAGVLAGDELPIIDKKLDRYISSKADDGNLSHLLIDRFRFDSFVPGRDAEKGSNLLTRFGKTVYLTFMITPPEATVERAWKRGLQVGRFKAIDDLLFHNIEAFNGIPELFFTWALRKNKIVHFEFLDNSVAHGEQPKTIAFGLNEAMYIVDFTCLININRYTRINIEAQSVEDVYPDAELMAADKNIQFLRDCSKQIENIYLVDKKSNEIYGHIQKGKAQWFDHQILKSVLVHEDSGIAICALSGREGFDLEWLSGVEQREGCLVPGDIREQVLGDLG